MAADSFITEMSAEDAETAFAIAQDRVRTVYDQEERIGTIADKTDFVEIIVSRERIKRELRAVADRISHLIERFEQTSERQWNASSAEQEMAPLVVAWYITDGDYHNPGNLSVSRDKALAHLRQRERILRLSSDDIDERTSIFDLIDHLIFDLKNDFNRTDGPAACVDLTPDRVSGIKHFVFFGVAPC